MSQLELIEQTRKRTARRIRLERMWRALWQGLLIGGAVWLALVGAYKLAPLPVWSLYAAASTGAGIVLIFVVLAGFRKMSLAETARFVDSRRQLKEWLSTAL